MLIKPMFCFLCYSTFVDTSQYLLEILDFGAVLLHNIIDKLLKENLIWTRNTKRYLPRGR